MFVFDSVRYKSILTIPSLFVQAQITAVTGPSGSGKTTFLRLLNKMISPTEGHILFEGTDLADLPTVEHRRRVMMLSQQTQLFPGTIRDNLLVGFELQNRSAPGNPVLLEALREVGLAHGLPTAADRLSGGERQRLALARVMLLRPKVLLLDEPSSALDDLSEEEVFQMLVRYVRQQELRAVFVTHSREMAKRFSDAHIRFAPGGTLAEVSS